MYKYIFYNFNAIQLILQSKTYNFGLGLKIAKRDFAIEF